MSEIEEAAIVRRCQNGDHEAFAVLVERHKTMLFGTAYLMTRDRHLAEDAVQEALIRMWKHIGCLRNPGGLKAWLAKIVVNEVRQQARKRKTLEVTLEDLPDLPETDQPDMGSVVTEMHHDLASALRMLSPEQREAVVLRYFSDLSVPEIAAAMGCRQGTIKSRLSRALMKLSEILRRDEMREGRE